MRQYAAKRDLNEQDIIKTLRGVGATVQPLSDKGVPDLLVGFRGVNYLLEVKMPTGGKLTSHQVDWHANWNGAAVVVTCPEEALEAIGAI